MREGITLLEGELVVLNVAFGVVGTSCFIRWREWSHERYKDDEEKGAKLPKESADWHFFFISTVPLLLLRTVCMPLGILLPSLTWLLEEATTKEHVEYFLWVDILFKMRSMVSAVTSTWWGWLIVSWLSTRLIIVCSFILVTQTHISWRNLLECLGCLGSPIFIRMKLNCKFLIRFFDIFFFAILWKIKNLIVICLGYDFLAVLDL